MAIRLLIFDLDGTLIDSARDITEALNSAMGPGVEPISVQQTKTMIGEGVMKLLNKLLDQRHVTTERRVLMERFLAYYSSHLDVYTVPYEGVEETLGRLSTYPKAVVSNKLERLSLKTLESLGLRHHFDYVVGGDTSPERKPSPKAILPVLERFGVAPEESIVVGDSIYDVEAGLAAGTKTVAVTYGYGAPGFAERAHYRIARFDDLLRVIDELNNGKPGQKS